MKKYLSFIFLYCSIFSCDILNDRGPANVLPHVTVNASLETRPVNLSDLMRVERIVLLETHADALLPDVSQIQALATNKYIIVKTLKAIYQFSSSGKFIRILSTQGNGPNEFLGITGFSVHSNNELLFYTHSGDPKHVVVINLESGYHQARILIPVDFEETGDKLGMAISGLTVDSIQNITCLISPHTKCKYSVFSMTLNRELRWYIERPQGYSIPWGERGYYRSIGSENHYKEPKNDTLYLIDNSGKRKPLLIFDIADYHESIKKRTVHGALPNETKWKIRYDGFNYFIIHRRAIHRYAGGAWAPVDGQHVLILKNENPFIIDNLYVDEFGFAQIAKSPLPIDFDGEVLIYKMNSVEFKENAEKVFSNASKKVERLLQELKASRSENDNPILLIGTTK